MRKPCVAGNWKMHKTISESVRLVQEMHAELEHVKEVENVICPPFPSLAPVSELLEGSSLKLGAQHMHWEEEGAYTGEVSPRMLAGLVQYVIIGHSERRAYFAETDETVNRRIHAALEYSLKPILCVGETLEENEAGKTAQVVTRQIQHGLNGVSLQDGEQIMIAYEPVWAIGTGKAATPRGANQVIEAYIRPGLASLVGEEMAQQIRVLYGGSVKPHNAVDFFTEDGIDGALVGGASLKADSFVKITQAAVD